MARVTRAARLPPGTRRAFKQYRDFRETDPKRTASIRMDLPPAMFAIGQCDQICYRTTIGGEARRYKHRFHPGSMPMLAAGTDERLYLVGGRYRVTERGIVDLDAHGHELDDD